MTAVSESHTVLWVPRFWPAVGGTEFHSHELAQHLSLTQRVTVLAHCTKTESLQGSLSLSASQAKATYHDSGKIRTITLAPSKLCRIPLTFLSRYHSKSRLARGLFQLCFARAYRKSAKAMIGDADRIHFIYNGLTEAACMASELARELNIPFIFTPNVLDTSATGSAWASHTFKLLYESADRLIALTTHEAKWLAAQGADPKKISVVPYGPILQDRLASEESGDVANILSSRFVLFLGRLVPEKGYQPLLKAFEKFAETDAETKLVLVGPAEDAVCDLINEVKHRVGSDF